jgi:YVTN family beta-propeller protein
MYTIDSDTGRLRHNGHVPTGRFPSSVVVHPSGRFVYVTEQTGQKVSAFSVNAETGKLTTLPGSPFDPGVVSPFWSALDKEGDFLYMAGRNSNALTAMRINQQTGALSLVEGAPYPGGYLPRSVAVHPSDRFVYMVTINDDSISAYEVNQTSGKLTEMKGSPFDAGDAPQFISIHPNGQYAYVTSWNSKELITFKLDQQTGALKKIQSLPFGVEASPFGISIHPNGRFVYAANWFGGTYGYVINNATGKLTAMKGSPFANFGELPVQVVVEPSGKFAYVTNFESYHVTAYAINPQTGELTAGETTSARAGPRAIAFLMGDKSPVVSTRFAYVANSASNTVSAYVVNAQTGKLKEVATVKAGLAPESLSIDPLNKFLYVANAKSDSISVYAIDKNIGKLSEIKGSPFKAGKNPVSITVDKIGKYVYATNQESDSLSVYAMNSDTGFLTELTKTDLYYASPYPIRKQPGKTLIDPSNRVLYVMSPTENKLSFFRYYNDGPIVVESIYGSPVYLEDIPTAIAIEPNGKYVYLSTEKNLLAAYKMNVRDGMLKMQGKPVRTGDDPVSIVVDPSGKYIYVTNRGSDLVSVYEVDTNTGQIKKKTADVKVGKDPNNIVIESSGKFAYVVNEGSDNVMVFGINEQNGELKLIEKVSAGTKPVAMVFTSEVH